MANYHHPNWKSLFLCSSLSSAIPLWLWFFVVRDVVVFRDALIQVYRNSLLVPMIVIIVGLVMGTELLVASFFFRYGAFLILFSQEALVGFI